MRRGVEESRGCTSGQGFDDGVLSSVVTRGVVLEIEAGVGRLPVDRGRLSRVYQDVGGKLESRHQQGVLRCTVSQRNQKRE